MDANLLELLVGASRPVEAVLARMDRSDDGRPTPCPEMSVAQVAAHLIGGMHTFATVAEGGELRFDSMLDPSFEQDRPAVLFRAAVDELRNAFGVPGRLEQSFAMPWGQTAGAQLVGFELIEVLAHGWDIARALGVALVVDDEVAAAVLDGARHWIDDSVRVPRMFGPEVAVRDASPLDALVAFLGRNPAWRPAGS